MTTSTGPTSVAPGASSRGRGRNTTPKRRNTTAIRTDDLAPRVRAAIARDVSSRRDRPRCPVRDRRLLRASPGGRAAGRRHRPIGRHARPGSAPGGSRAGSSTSALQELAFDAEFDGSMTIDAMENVPPEDWPIVLGNLHRAVRPGGHLYLTVEEVDAGGDRCGVRGQPRQGLPAVHGEVIEGDTAGYHYYPGREQVLAWLAAEGLEVVREGVGRGRNWGYRHLLLRTGANSRPAVRIRSCTPARRCPGGRRAPPCSRSR